MFPPSACVSTADFLDGHNCGFITAGVFGLRENLGWWAAKHTASLRQEPARQRSINISTLSGTTKTYKKCINVLMNVGAQ